GYLSTIAHCLHDFDKTNDSLVYLVQKAPSAEHFFYLMDSLEMLRMNLGASVKHGLSFLTKEDFKLFVDKSYPEDQGGYYILTGLKNLSDSYLLDEFHDKFIDCEKYN